MDSHLCQVIFDTIHDGLFTVDRNCVITAFNPAAERITGYKAAAAVGQVCYRLFQTYLCDKRCPVQCLIEDGLSESTVRVTLHRRNGSTVPVLMIITLLRDDAGATTGAVVFFRDLSDVERLKRQLQSLSPAQDFVTIHEPLQRTLALLPDIASSECSVLIQGPSGSGKELIARAIHTLSPRHQGPYIRINCGALPATLLESELFGYEKGAFTDARQAKPGMFALAHDGTLLLDEIGNMDVALQAKLLRVLNDGEFQPLGSTKTQTTNARIIASSNEDLERMIGEKRFREDLFFRINVVTVTLPPLCERPEDIPHLVDHFTKRIGERTRKPIERAAPETIALLRRYTWPGNVRELENAIEHAFVLCHGDTITPDHLPPRILDAIHRGPTAPHGLPQERDILLDALRRHHGNRTAAAKELGIHRTTLWRRLARLGVDGGGV